MNWRDFAERVGWSAIYALASAGFVVLTSDNIIWGDAIKFVGITVALAVIKVVLAQRAGDTTTGEAWPGGVTKP